MLICICYITLLSCSLTNSPLVTPEEKVPRTPVVLKMATQFRKKEWRTRFLDENLCVRAKSIKCSDIMSEKKIPLLVGHLQPADK